jgi:predicted DCC family thiol-disulfide oxidoreductase YuxK
MTASANPLSRAFWLGDFDARALALFRMTFALFAMAHLWQLPLAEVATGGAKVALLVVAYLVFLSLLVGHRARWASVVGWLMLLILGGRSPLLLDAGEHALRLLAFFLVWSDVGASFSLDVGLGRRPAERRVVALAPRFLQLAILFCAVGWPLLGRAHPLDALVVALVGAPLFLSTRVMDRAQAWLARRVSPATVLYDGRCTFCRGSMEGLLAFDLLDRLTPLDSHASETRARFPTLDPEQVQRELVVALPPKADRPGDRFAGGFDAFRVIAWRIPSLMPFAPLLYLPLVRPIGRVVYAFVAKRRLRIAGVCTLGPGAPLDRRPASDGPAHAAGIHWLLAGALSLQAALLVAARVAELPLALSTELRLLGL